MSEVAGEPQDEGTEAETSEDPSVQERIEEILEEETQEHDTLSEDED